MKTFAMLFRTSIIAALMGLMFGAVAAEECPLCDAAYDSDLAQVKRLIAAGADVNAANKGGWTALMVAATEGYSEITKVLLSADANPNAAKDDGWTALMAAAQEGHAEVAKALLSADANLNAATNDDWTALMVATQEGHAEVAKVLLSANANPNAAKDDGITALMVAAIHGHSKVAKVLLSAGANPNTVKNSATALTLAKQETSNPSIFDRALINAINGANGEGLTALMFAAQEGHAEVAKVLLDNGANPDLSDSLGNTAWDYIKGKRRLELVFEKHLEEWRKKQQ